VELVRSQEDVRRVTGDKIVGVKKNKKIWVKRVS